jgi:creatinine amidohydrolase
MKEIALLFLTVASLMNTSGQDVKMRTRMLPSLTNVEVEKYLERNDIIFIPVGTVEVHGALPLDCEYVGPLAFAMKMAEKVDGLVLPNLMYFYPGATSTGRGSVHVTVTGGEAYLKEIARSLLRQGFKTQIYITGHGPAYSYIQPLLFEFLDEEKVPLLHMDEATLHHLVEGVNTSKIVYGAYSIAGRLEDIPLSFEGFDLSEGMSTSNSWSGTLEQLGKLWPLNTAPIQATQWYFSSQFDHGGVPKSITAAEREQWAKEGVEAIEKIVDGMGMDEIIISLRRHQKYIEDMVTKYGDLLPE